MSLTIIGIILLSLMVALLILRYIATNIIKNTRVIFFKKQNHSSKVNLYYGKVESLTEDEESLKIMVDDDDGFITEFEINLNNVLFLINAKSVRNVIREFKKHSSDNEVTSHYRIAASLDDRIWNDLKSNMKMDRLRTGILRFAHSKLLTTTLFILGTTFLTYEKITQILL